MTTVRLAYAGPPGALEHGLGSLFTINDQPTKPALLVSYVYLKTFMKHRHRYDIRDWVLDSGAFSAHASGKEISLQAYIDTAKQLLETDPLLTEVFALDVIGDWQASLRNCEEMWRQGVPAIPCYHVGSPERELVAIARDYPKIALGGAVGYKQKLSWAQQCFARVYPKRIHGFGFHAEKDIMALPWHSVDASNWELGPCKFGRWKRYGNLRIRGSRQPLRAEVEEYLKMEARAQMRWQVEIQRLGGETNVPSVRLAYSRPGSLDFRTKGQT